MDWKDIAATVGKAAPLLGTLLGGPADGSGDVFPVHFYIS